MSDYHNNSLASSVPELMNALVLLDFLAILCSSHHILWSCDGIQLQNVSLQCSVWSAGLTDRNRGVYYISTPRNSSEHINGEDGQGNSYINY